MKVRIIQRTRQRLIGSATRTLADGVLEFRAGSTSADDGDDRGILEDAAPAGLVLQDFQPIPESLEWRLGRAYWEARGASAFFDGSVPYRVTNDGELSRKAAAVLLAGLVEGTNPPRASAGICVLELGAGCGLFARFFLDAFRDLCHRGGHDFYDRLVYLATDRSERMRSDLERHQLLREHRGHYRIEAADATKDGFGLAETASNSARPAPGFHAIFLNYVLDCLPATVLKISGGELTELVIRTSVARGVRLSQHTAMNHAEVLACVASEDPAEHARLLDLFPVLALEHDYRPVDCDQVPFADAARAAAGPDEGVVLHNHGALRCLEEALSLLMPGGFALVNDYDDSPFDEHTQSYRYQHFDGSVAFGLNARLLATQFGSRADCGWMEARGGGSQLVSHLLSAGAAPPVRRAFRRLFGRADDRYFQTVKEAREFVRAGRREAALGSYRKAFRRRPGNWALAVEVADFLLFTLQDYPTALRVAEAGLEANPRSSELWNARGDALYYLGREDEAHESFQRALEIHPREVRARYNLSFTLVRRHEWEAALHLIGEALALDRGGRYRERLLRQQAEILDQQVEVREIEARCLADRWLSTGG